MFSCLYFNITINEPKEEFRTVFCSFSEIKNVASPLCSSSFPMNLIPWGILLFDCLDRSMPMSL